MGDLGDEVLALERYKHEKRQSSSFMTPDELLNNSINSVANSNSRNNSYTSSPFNGSNRNSSISSTKGD